jgi:hypothetical protein
MSGVMAGDKRYKPQTCIKTIFLHHRVFYA